MLERAAAEKSTVLEKTLRVIVLITEVLCIELVLASPGSRGIHCCCHINSHQITLMKSIVMLKIHTYVGGMESHHQRVESHAFKRTNDILGSSCVHQLLRVCVRTACHAALEGAISHYQILSVIEIIAVGVILLRHEYPLRTREFVVCKSLTLFSRSGWA